MEQERIRDFNGRTIGWYEYEPNGDIIVREFGGRILGKYDARDNVTREFSGRIIAQGNVIGMLLK